MVDSYRDRLIKAAQELSTLDQKIPQSAKNEHIRLQGKIEGVRLALSYYDETHPWVRVLYSQR